DLLAAPAPKGVFISEDQTLSVMVNGKDHLTLRAQYAGLPLQEAWSRVNLADDSLASVMDFAYAGNRGYLTADLAHVGTGLKFGVWLHLPALAGLGELAHRTEDVLRHQAVLRGIKTGTGTAGEPPVRPSDPARPAVRPESRVSQSIANDIEGACAGSLHEAAGDL